jgi:DNA polymerase-3 subunit alpha
MCEQYVQIRQGARHPYFVHPNVEAALTPTFGVLVYQEQVMQIARDYAGLSFADADHIRKAMGKKDAAKMAEWKDRFVAGAVTTSGVASSQAEALWSEIEGFAAYGFNKSHAVEYAVISFWAMWLKTHYPSEFYAATLSIQDKEEKLGPLVMDAKAKGVKILPPDLNRSSKQIEIHGGDLYAPFQAIKGISDNVADAIVELREASGGWFSDTTALDPKQQKVLCPAWPRVKINAAHREALARVGALWSLDRTGPEPMHADRLKDRIELMPGWSVELVKADRKINPDRIVQLKLIETIGKLHTCDGCSLKGSVHPAPRMGKTPKFMVVFDSPNWQEEKAKRMFEGDAASWLKDALTDAGLSANDGYYTALVKAPKRSGQKMLTNEQINGCSVHLEKEIELLKPPVILVLGSAAMRYFAPQFKGSTVDMAGKSFFNAKLDASIVIGINPMQLHHDPSKAMVLLDACKVVASAVNT